MDNAASEKSIIALDSWLQTPAGAYVRAWEQAQLDALVADIFGYNAVQIGLPQIDALAANRMPRKWLADIRPRPRLDNVTELRQVAVTFDYAELPFASQSLDLVVLPHVLEFAAEPHQVLREVERVLIPEGQVIICGFNPASLWGLRQVTGRLTGSHFLPPAGEFISMPRMRDWLKLLNLGATTSHFGCYAPACRTEKWLQRCAFMDRAGPRWWPYLGAVYMVQAIKRVKGMRLIGPAWTRKRAAAPVAVPATNKRRESQDGQG
jgi:SAM-dependent methyltransferase